MNGNHKIIPAGLNTLQKGVGIYFIRMAQTNEFNSEVGTASKSEESVAASLGLDPQLFVFQLINFAVVVVIIWYLILRPLTKKLDERRKIIDESLDRAKEIETQYAMSEQKYKERLDKAERDANEVMAQARGEAEAAAVEMKEKTKREILELATEAKQHIQKEREDALAAVRKEAATLIVAATEKLIGEKIDVKKDEQFIEGMSGSLKK